MKSNIKENLFLHPNKISSYIMGFIWGDGYLPSKHNSIFLEIVDNDWQYIKPVFDKIGDYCVKSRQRKNRQKQTTISFSNQNIKNLLINLNYNKKSYYSHKKAIEFIPDKYKHYWVRGLFDADGCIYRYDKEYLRQFSICSTYLQDWKYLQHLLLGDNIYCKIEQRIQKKIKGINQSSIIRGSGSKNIQNLYNYLYPKGYDGIGLPRKHDKMLSIVTDFC